MGGNFSRSATIARKVKAAKQTVVAPRDRFDPKKDWRFNPEVQQFKDDWFPNSLFDQNLPINEDPVDLATPKRSAAPVTMNRNPAPNEIPPLASKDQNRELIKYLNYLGRGTIDSPHDSTQMGRMPRTESKMPKSRVSLPQKKLKGYLDAKQFKEIFDLSASMSTEEIANRFETDKTLLDNIFMYTSWIKQPSSSNIDDGSSNTTNKYKPFDYDKKMSDDFDKQWT